jgi:class 3 adenylate cyclase
VDVSEAERAHLRAQGANDDEIDRAAAHDDLFALAGDLVRRRGMVWVPVERVAEAARSSIEDVERYRLVAGLPPAEGLVPASTAFGVESYRVAAAAAGDEVAREYVRAVAAAAAKVAATATALFLNDVAPRIRALQLGQVATLELVEAMTSELVTRTPRAFETAFQEHLLISARRGRLEHEAEFARVAVGFVDLAGSTTWAEHTDQLAQAAALSRFEDGAWSAASSHDVRVVKMIGDEAMFVGSDARAVVLAALDLCDVAGTDTELPPARGAVGYGHAFARGGDYFGPLVNLVARAVKAADPWQLCVTLPVAATLEGPGFALGQRQEYRFRGIDEPVELVPVRRDARP